MAKVKRQERMLTENEMLDYKLDRAGGETTSDEL